MTREEYRRYLEEFCSKKACFEQPGARCDTCMYEKGRADREMEIIDTIEQFAKDWNNQSSKKISYKAINELVEYIRQSRQRNS